jgi:hypothetical protein
VYGDITKKLLLPIVALPSVFKTKTQQLAAIDGVELIYLKNVKDQSF